jgi:hypothetical protein
VWLHFIKLKEANDDLKDLTSKEQDLSQKAAEVNKLRQTLQSMQDKGRTVEKLKGLRSVDWVKKLMELTKAIDKTEGWLTGLQFRLAGGKGTLELSCAVRGANRRALIQNVENFLNNLGYKNGIKGGEFSSFWNSFIDRTPDDYYRGLVSTQTVGKWTVTKFKLKLELKPEVASSITIN